MDPPTCRRLCSLVGFLLLACRDSPPPAHTLPAALSHALATLPWTHGASGGPALCPTLAPCDTVWLEPRVVRLPYPPPAFFVPDARAAALVLTDADLGAAPELPRLGRVVRVGSWTTCLAQRHDPGWATYRRACVAFGIAGDSLTSDTLHLAGLLLSPSGGLRWPRLRLAFTAHGWRGGVISMGSE